jgi:Spy/CpxP family protein refolding chaperone
LVNSIYQEWRDANLAKGVGQRQLPQAPPSFTTSQRWNDFDTAAGAWMADSLAAGLPPRQQPDPVMGALFPPELVMAHQREIGLQDAQRAKLVAAMNTAQARFTEVQWTLSGEQDKLQQLVQTVAVDETAVQKQLDRILSMEDDLKRTQLLLMVRVKNILTPEQQGQLATFRQPPCLSPTAQSDAPFARQLLPAPGARPDIGAVQAPPQGQGQARAKAQTQGQGQPQPSQGRQGQVLQGQAQRLPPSGPASPCASAMKKMPPGE